MLYLDCRTVMDLLDFMGCGTACIYTGIVGVIGFHGVSSRVTDQCTPDC